MTNSNSRDGKLSELLAELKADYRKSFPAKILVLQNAFDRRDVHSLTEEFHKLKGTGKTYGYPEVSLLCEALETACRSGAPDFSQVEKVFSVFARMLEAWKDGKNFDLRGDTEANLLLETLARQETR